MVAGGVVAGGGLVAGGLAGRAGAVTARARQSVALGAAPSAWTLSRNAAPAGAPQLYRWPRPE